MSTLTYILISLAFSAFFSGMEIAFISSNKLRFELDKKEKSLTTKILDIFYKNPSQFISTMLVGNNIALVVYGLQMAIILEPFIARVVENEFLIVFIQSVISTTYEYIASLHCLVMLPNLYSSSAIFLMVSNWAKKTL